MPAGSASATPDNAVLLRVFVKHDQSRPLAELNAQLARQAFYKAFPPPGDEVASWTVTTGIGQIVALRLPASRLREVNRVHEDRAWRAYGTEFYPAPFLKPACARGFALVRAAFRGEFLPNPESVIHPMKHPRRFPV